MKASSLMERMERSLGKEALAHASDSLPGGGSDGAAAGLPTELQTTASAPDSSAHVIEARIASQSDILRARAATLLKLLAAATDA
jgi:hypothetical protein